MWFDLNRIDKKKIKSSRDSQVVEWSTYIECLHNRSLSIDELSWVELSCWCCCAIFSALLCWWNCLLITRYCARVRVKITLKSIRTIFNSHCDVRRDSQQIHVEWKKKKNIYFCTWNRIFLCYQFFSFFFVFTLFYPVCVCERRRDKVAKNSQEKTSNEIQFLYHRYKFQHTSLLL